MIAGPERSELQDIIVYFTYKTHHLTEARLNKLIYVGEIYHIEKFGRRMTDVPFLHHHHHGPWSGRICAEGEIISGTDIKVEDGITPDGYEATFFVPIEGKRMAVSLSEEKISILDDVVADWKFKSTKDLVKFAKSTRPFQRSKFGEVLDLDNYAKKLMKLVYSKEAIESVERSQREAREGKGRIFINKTELQRYYDEL